MVPNPCCCWGLRDAANAVGVWSTCYGAIQLIVFAWQTFAVSYERDRAANVPFPNFDSYGRPDVPFSFDRDWLTFEGRYYFALFWVQLICLATSIALFFASLGLLYGVRRWSRSWVMPWLVLMPLSVLTSLAYCITWWAGYVRGYWVVLTVLQLAALSLNCYCFFVVVSFYRYMRARIAYFENRMSHAAEWKRPTGRLGSRLGSLQSQRTFAVPRSEATLQQPSYNARMPASRQQQYSGTPAYDTRPLPLMTFP